LSFLINLRKKKAVTRLKTEVEIKRVEEKIKDAIVKLKTIQKR
jgi:hypothetical protein